MQKTPVFTALYDYKCQEGQSSSPLPSQLFLSGDAAIIGRAYDSVFEKVGNPEEDTALFQELQTISTVAQAFSIKKQASCKKR